MPNPKTSARALGWFSLGLGTAQVLLPNTIARVVGLRPGPASRRTMRLVGGRELAAGVSLLAGARPTVGQWARVAGDVMDIALLGGALAAPDNRRARVAAALSVVSGLAAADYQTARALSDGDGESDRREHLVKAITVNRSIEDVYRFWRDFRNFPSFMSHVQSVAVMDDRHSHWTVSGPAGQLIEWDAEITEDRPNELIAWRSLDNAQVRNSGDVRFAAAPAGRGTEVHVHLEYVPPAGALGVTLARLWGQEPRQQVQADLRKVKQVLETGEVIRSDATISGTHIFQRPAQPARPGEAAPARAQRTRS